MILFSWVIEFFCWSTNAVTYFIPKIELTSNKNTNGKSHIVLLSPGFTGPILYYFLKKHLEKKGHKVTILNFSKEMGDLETAAEKLKTRLEKEDFKNIHLIGVSSAGLVALEYLHNHKGWEKVNRFIPIATPFKGTLTSYFTYYSKAGRQLVPNSNYIKKVSEIKPINLDKIHHLIAKKDELVPRWASSHKDIKGIELPVIGHVRLHAFSKKTFDKIAEIVSS